MDAVRKYNSRFSKIGPYIQNISRYLPQVLAISMLFYGIAAVYGDIKFYIEVFEITSLLELLYLVISDLIILLGGVLILCYKKVTILKAAAIYLITVGVGRALYYLPELLADSVISYVIGLVFIALSLTLIYRGFTFFKGVPSNLLPTTISVLALALLNSVFLIVNMRYSTGPLVDQAMSQADLILLVLLYVVFLGVLDSSEIRLSTGSECLDEGLTSVRKGYCASENNTFISETEAETIRNGFSDMSGWSMIDGESPVSHEYSFRISDDFSNSEVLVQRWKDSDALHFTIADSFTGSVLFARRFSANRCSIVADPETEGNSWLYIYDEKGSFMRFRIVPDTFIQTLGGGL